MMFYNSLWFYNAIKTIANEKKENDTFLRKQTEEKQNKVTIMVYIDEKWAFFPIKLKVVGELLNKRY